MLCSGLCGRVGAGHIDSGGRFSPAEDQRHSWCDECWSDLVVHRRIPEGLVKHLPPGTYVRFSPPSLSAPELNSLGRVGHKILSGAGHKSVAAAAAALVTGSGTFTGYIASFARDHEGDTITGPAAVADTVKAVNSGAIQWLLTDEHSSRTADVVAVVTSAAVDSRGVRVEASWMPDELAQSLRRKVVAGAKLGLSIDYLVDAERPDGQGGRLLDRIRIVGGALTAHPMNPMATIIESKGAGFQVPVVDIYADAQARHRDPGRDRAAAEDAMLAGLDWPPRHWDRQTRLAIIRGAAEAKARRALAGDPVAAREQAIRDQDNAYCNALSSWMAAHK